MGRIRGDINPFTWVINDFSTLQSEIIYSDEFQIGGCKWRLMAYPKGDRFRNYMSLYLDVADSKHLPCGLRRSARFHLTVVNQRYPGRSITRSKIHRFDQKTSAAGFIKMIHHSKLFDEEGFVVDGKVKILVRIHVFLVIVGNVNVIEVSDEGSEEESKEISEEGSKEESEEISEEGSKEEFEEGSKEGSEEGSESDSDTESEEASSPLKKTKLNDDGNTSNDLHSKTQQVKETIDVNGFQVLPSQVELVKRIFEKYPDMALGFRAKNQILRTACMNVLLSLIETLCQSPQELSKEDLVEADNALAYVVDAGFKVDWLEKKLKEVKGKKKEEQNGETRIQELEEELVDFKQKCSDTEALLEKEKAKVLAARASLTLDDIV